VRRSRGLTWLGKWKANRPLSNGKAPLRTGNFNRRMEKLSRRSRPNRERTSYHSDIDIYLCSTHQSTSGDVPSEADGWAIRRGYDQHSDFVVYNKPDCIFQIILIEDDEKIPLEDLASFILYSFDMQICQCAIMPDGEYLLVDGCMKSAPSKSSRVRKYEDRIAKHDLKCNAVCFKHWKSVY